MVTTRLSGQNTLLIAATLEELPQFKSEVQHCPLSVHEGCAFMDRQGKTVGAKHLFNAEAASISTFRHCRRRNPAMQGPAAGPAGVRIQHPPLRTRRRTSPVWGSGREQ
ncbi:MAG: hypothetical protein OXF73_11945, partial [Gammaproteobacteria bacterium]|nr:hypothetical protein [Gammaproteobacteria bacterium]